MGIEDTTLPTPPIISSNSKTFHGLNIHPCTEDIFITDVGNFTERGTIYRYDKNFNLISDSEVGIIPSYIKFK